MSLDVAAPNLIVRAIVVYLVVLVLLRISGKRQVGQMGPTEFVAVLLLSNAVQNAMNGGDNSLAGGLLLAAVLVFLSFLISHFTYRSKWISSIFEGTPTLLIHNGRTIRRGLLKERLTESELKSLLRKQGIRTIGEVRSAVLESDGTLSVIHSSEPVPEGQSTWSNGSEVY